ncbi:MAG: hypothetical protein A2289_08260 [Deltaproteobacteria bacterium RIFOXYA12_FULL_58_15]|nr:MAG: hypothetical protein A2289_08260 [Deltaproteobacteria bacterium RIFOXYA12_FULL_58_15]OGR09122.1 MAG: hypothetical protein A2341_10915 [Deltaproteobacteria bacterium RIFOXYB12_FULL_58_9]
MKTLGVVLCGWILMVPTWASAQVAHGQVNWSDKTITATGSGAPSLKAPNVAVARLGAERAAKMDALRNILEAVKGVRVESGKSAGDLMSTAEVKSRVEGIVRDFKVMDTKYYSDGGVDVVVQVSIDGVLAEALVPNAGAKAAEPAAESGGVTGLIVNAKGLGVTPALAPKILDEAGNEVYSVSNATSDAVKKHGVAGYTNALDLAMKDGRVAEKPLVVRAQKLTQKGGSDLVIATEDAKKLANLGGVLANSKVIIVTD